MMDAITALKQRRSIRRYQDREIPKELLEDIIDCGRLAASANNLQPWEFIAVTDKEKLAMIARAATYGKFIAQAAACVVVLGRKDARYFIEDCSAATQNIMVAAKAHGLGSCWVAGYGKEYSGDIAEALSVPDAYTPISFISIGYPAENPVKPKRSLDEVLHWERY